MKKAFLSLLFACMLAVAGYMIIKSYYPNMLSKSQQPTLPTGSSSQENVIKEPAASPDNLPAKKETFKVKTADGKGIITPGITSDMLESSFWTNLLEDEAVPVMSSEQVSSFNKDIIQKVSVVYDLTDYKEKLSREELTNFIKHYKTPDKTMYDYGGKAITKSFYDTLVNNTNLGAVKDTNDVKYGIVVKKASVRSFPTETGAYNTSSNQTLDRFQETGCEPCEPVLILHESKDKNWYFVQVYNYRGWMKKDSVALASSKEDVFGYTNHTEFLMVTGKKISPVQDGDKPQSAEFSMGTKLYLSKTIKDGNTISYYEVKLPIRSNDGSLQFTTAKISGTDDVSVGYLPYTRYNIITQAFKMQGTPYDWGDKYSGRDCSSFLMYVFKTFGINLPRNTDEQEICSNNMVKFNAQDNLQTRLKIMDGLAAGEVLYMPGHTMLYLGKINGQYYMLHAFLGYNAKNGGTSKYYPVNQVAVTSVQIQNSENTPFIMKFTSALKMEH